jgi:starch-binding outer membrane protein, SusD/RagB family
MKVVKKALLVFLALPLLSACDDFLKEVPYSSVAPENFFKTATDAELALTGVYDVLNTGNIQGQGNHHMWGRGIQYLSILGNDELVAAANTEAQFKEYSYYTYTSQTQTAAFTWVFLYGGINRANYLLERVPAIAMDADRKKEILAEARFMRGMFYFYLGWLWGGAPITTTATPELASPRSSLQAVMGQAEADLQKAYADLPARNVKVGRVNKYTAAGFLAKLYLYLASARENNVGASLNPTELNSFSWVDHQQMYEQAEQVCEDIYANSGYTLIRPYRNLFLAATETEARNEHMMLVQAGPNGSTEYILSAYLSGPVGNVTTNGGTYGRMKPVKELYNKYHASDGRRAHNMTGSINTAGAALNDPARFTIINNVKYFNPDAVNASFSNLNLGKYREADPLSKTSRGIANWAGETDYGVLRYADVLLMYAEARFKRGNEAGARELLREVRLRACDGDLARVNALTADYRAKANNDFMQELLDERSRELCGEGWRRFDLIRTGKLKQVVTSLKEQAPDAIAALIPLIKEVKVNFEDHEIWYPIPARELELNNQLVQNPGYPK